MRAQRYFAAEHPIPRLIYLYVGHRVKTLTCNVIPYKDLNVSPLNVLQQTMDGYARTVIDAALALNHLQIVIMLLLGVLFPTLSALSVAILGNMVSLKHRQAGFHPYFFFRQVVKLIAYWCAWPVSGLKMFRK